MLGSTPVDICHPTIFKCPISWLQVCLAVPFSRAFLKLNFLIKFFLTLEAVRAADDHRAIRRSFVSVTLILTRLPCGVRYSARYQLWDLREGFWKKPDQRQNADHQHKICNLRKKNGSPTCATCFPTSSFWCMFTSFPSHSRFWELCPYTLKLSAPCICWNILG